MAGGCPLASRTVVRQVSGSKHQASALMAVVRI
jgi:hypothetical protein